MHRDRESLLVTRVDVLHRGIAFGMVNFSSKSQCLGDIVVVRAYPFSQPDHWPLLIELVIRLRDYIHDQGVVSGPVGAHRISVQVVGEGYPCRDIIDPPIDSVVAVLLVGPEAHHDCPAVIELGQSPGSLQDQSDPGPIVMRAYLRAPSRWASWLGDVEVRS